MKNDVTSTASDFVDDLGTAVRENPVSAALIGMGLVWLLTGAGNPVSRAQGLARRAGVDRLPGAASDVYGSGRDAISTGYGAIAETASSAAARARDTMREIPDRSGQLLSGVKGNLTDLFEQQPLFLGAVGIAIGAGIAASLPTTNLETELLGQTSGEFRENASQFMTQQRKNVTGIVSGMATAVQEEAIAQGFSADGLQKVADTTLETLKRVGAAASDSVKDRLTGDTPAGDRG